MGWKPLVSLIWLVVGKGSVRIPFPILPPRTTRLYPHLMHQMHRDGRKQKVKSLPIWSDKAVLYLHIFPGLETHSDSGKEIFGSSDATFEKTKSTGTLSLGKRITLNGKQRRPLNILLIQGEAIMKLITSPMKPRLNSLPGFPNTLDKKWALYDNKFTHDEKGLKTNPLPHRSNDREARRDAMENQNLPGFISKNSMNDPFGTKRKALFLGGK